MTRLINCSCAHGKEAHYESWDKKDIYCLGDNIVVHSNTGGATIQVTCKCKGFMGDNLEYMLSLYEEKTL